MKKARQKKSTYCMIPFIKIIENPNDFIVIESILVVVWGLGEGVGGRRPYSGPEVTSGSDRFVHYLDCDDDFYGYIHISKYIKLYFKYM